MRGRVIAAWLSCAVFGCGSSTTEWTEIPDLDSWSSVIVIGESNPVVEAPVDAFDLSDGVATFELREDTDQFALVYPHPLSVLQLAEGRIPPQEDEQAPSRHLPTPARAFRLEGNAGQRAWVEVDPNDSSVFRAFLIADRGAQRCAAEGGCYSDHPYGLCTVPCPAPRELMPPEDPMPPALPEISCPTGWAEVAGDPVSRCEPFEVDAPGVCASPFELVTPGSACRLVGGACPVGPWAEGLPAGSTLYVDAAGTQGGDGSSAAPYATISDALANASAGATIAVAKGLYEEALDIPEGIRIIGACPAETVIRAPIGASPAVTVSHPGAALERVRLEGAAGGIRVSSFGATLEATSVIVVPTIDRWAVDVSDGGSLSAQDLSILSSTPYGITVSGGASVHIERAMITNLWLSDDSGAQVVDSVLAFPDSPAVQVDRSSDLVFQRSVLWQPTGDGLVVHGRALIEDALIRGNGIPQNGGSGLSGTQGSTITVSRTRIEQSLVGMLVSGLTELTDVVVQNEGNGFASDIEVFGPAPMLTASRVAMLGTSLTGLNGHHVELDVEDLTIRRDNEAPEVEAMLLAEDASGTIRRLETSGKRSGGVRIIQSQISFQSLTVGGSGMMEHATFCMNGAEVDGSRIAVLSGATNSVGIWGGRVDFSDLRVRGGSRGGIGVNDSEVSLERVLVDGTTGYGLSVEQAGGHLIGRDIRVAGVKGQAGRCSATCTGSALIAGSEQAIGGMATVELDGFLLEGSGIGVYVGASGWALLSDGIVRNNAVGAFVGRDDLGLELLMDRVVYDQNTTEAIQTDR